VNNHLSEDQITEWVLGTRDEFVRRHLETCDACSREAEELHRTISSFRDSIHATAQRDQSFWRNQQLAIRKKVSARDWYPLHWAWAVAMVMVLITALILTRPPNSPQNNASEDADKALLQEVQGDLAREVPEALAPAVLIAEERNAIVTNQVVRQSQNLQKKRRQKE
jgi:hypothetical protein